MSHQLIQRIYSRFIEQKKALEKKFWPSSHSNVGYNRHLWNFYARHWNKSLTYTEDKTLTAKDVNCLGDEWGNRKDVQDVLAGYVYPYINKQCVVGEIGTGGGRVASQVVDRVQAFHCFDISDEMLKKVKAALKAYPQAQFHLLSEAKLPEECVEQFDFLYSFDVFPHLDLHTHWQYFQEIHRCLKSKGKAFIHTSNLLAPDGWKRFAVQKEFAVEGHYFVSPDIIKILAAHAYLKVIKESRIDSNNFYYNRDYLVILEKS